MNHTISKDKTLLPDRSSGGHAYALKSGDLLGQYRIIKPLGAGGMGEVYEVEHSTLETRYALKLLPSVLDWQGVSLERFRREAKVMAQLNHPNILKVDDFGETGGRYWLRMELVEGTSIQGLGKHVVSLQDLADEYGGKIPQEELLPILKQILEGLDYAHKHGAIHRDLKPSNILLYSLKPDVRTPNSPFVKIADFGLVKLVGEDWIHSQAQLSVRRSMSDAQSISDAKTEVGTSPSEGTSTRALLGTFEYMSPEQKRGDAVDARSDLYAIGLIAYRLLTGRNIGPKAPSHIASNIALAWDDFVESALEESIHLRLKNASEGLTLFKIIKSQIKGGNHLKARINDVQLASSKQQISFNRGINSDINNDARKPGTSEQIDLGNDVFLDLVWIPSGVFVMGSPENESDRDHFEGPQHEVTISRGFWMGKYEVTQRQYLHLMGVNPAEFTLVGLDAPVESINWHDALEFCSRLQTILCGQLLGRIVDLPTEAEWEYACRAGMKTPFCTGEYLGMADANCEGKYQAKCNESGIMIGSTVKVGSYLPNDWGLQDMHGNVSEMCKTGPRQYDDYPISDPGLHEKYTGSTIIIRGGSWCSPASNCRSACRETWEIGSCGPSVGFRIVVR